MFGLTLQNPKGRLTHQYNSNHAQRAYSYDTMGRLNAQWDCLPSNCGTGVYSTSFAYDLGGNLTQLTYPSGRVVTYTNNTAGRPQQATLTSVGGQSLNFPYVNSVNYSPAGAISALAPGSGLTETLTYNNRLETTRSTVASSVLTAMDHSLTYADGSGHNNGNIYSIVDQLNSAKTQSFTYDQLNRLSSATETAWGLGFVYDPWGNLLQQNVTLGSAPPLSVSVNNKNQMNGYTFDAAGNMTSDGFNTYQYDPENKLKSLNTTGATYTYDVDGMRVAKTIGSDTHEYLVARGQILTDHHGSDWTDYIFVGGRQVAKADSFEDRIHIQGTNCSGCGSQYSLYAFPSAAGYSGYVIRAGDKLMLRQWQSSGAHGGMQIAFSDGTNTNWSVTDQDGNQLNNDGTQQTWHYRRIDLSSYAGKSINLIYVVQESTTGAGLWDIYFNDVSLFSTDGTVRPLYNRQTSVSLSMSGSSGVTGRMYEVNHLSGIAGTPDETTNYYHPDHLGSARMMSSVNGYPVWQATYLPFGYEYNQQTGVNTYKFTGKERDPESGLDYFGARYYGSSTGRFLSSDEPFYDGDLTDPQKLNLYGYVRNNPAIGIDPDGHKVQVCVDGKCRTMNDQEYYDAIHGNNPGISAPEFGKSGDITCGGAVCGHVTYWDEGHVNAEGENILAGIALGKVFGRVAGWGLGKVAGWLERGSGAVSGDAVGTVETESVNLADQKATTHILDGDATGGGHAPGTGISGKSEFPAGWSRDKIMQEISDVATDPASKVTQAGRTTVVEGSREGIDIRVIVRDGRIVTGYPTNVPRNP